MGRGWVQEKLGALHSPSKCEGVAVPWALSLLPPVKRFQFWLPVSPMMVSLHQVSLSSIDIAAYADGLKVLTPGFMVQVRKQDFNVAISPHSTI